MLFEKNFDFLLYLPSSGIKMTSKVSRKYNLYKMCITSAEIEVCVDMQQRFVDFGRKTKFWAFMESNLQIIRSKSFHIIVCSLHHTTVTYCLLAQLQFWNVSYDLNWALIEKNVQLSTNSLNFFFHLYYRLLTDSKISNFIISYTDCLYFDLPPRNPLNSMKKNYPSSALFNICSTFYLENMLSLLLRWFSWFVENVTFRMWSSSSLSSANWWLTFSASNQIISNWRIFCHHPNRFRFIPTEITHNSYVCQEYIMLFITPFSHLANAEYMENVLVWATCIDIVVHDDIYHTFQNSPKHWAKIGGGVSWNLIIQISSMYFVLL